MKLLLLAVVATCCSASTGTLMPFTAAEKAEILKLHNKGRQDEGANLSPLAWDDRLEKTVGDWLKTCTWGHSENVFITVNGEKVEAGQNMWQGFTSAQTFRPSGAGAVKSWLSEKQYYDYDAIKCNAPPGKACGHYTQIVWDTTTLVGCSRVRCPDKDNWRRAMIGCDYAPGGNYQGVRPFKKPASGASKPKPAAPEPKPVAPAGGSKSVPATTPPPPTTYVEEHWTTTEVYYPERAPTEQHETTITHYGPNGEVLEEHTLTEHYGPPSKRAANKRVQSVKARALESMLAEIGGTSDEYELEATVEQSKKRVTKSELTEELKRLIAAIQAFKQ